MCVRYIICSVILNCSLFLNVPPHSFPPFSPFSFSSSLFQSIWPSCENYPGGAGTVWQVWLCSRWGPAERRRPLRQCAWCSPHVIVWKTALRLVIHVENAPLANSWVKLRSHTPPEITILHPCWYPVQCFKYRLMFKYRLFTPDLACQMWFVRTSFSEVTRSRCASDPNSAVMPGSCGPALRQVVLLKCKGSCSIPVLLLPETQWTVENVIASLIYPPHAVQKPLTHSNGQPLRWSHPTVRRQKSVLIKEWRCGEMTKTVEHGQENFSDILQEFRTLSLSVPDNNY